MNQSNRAETELPMWDYCDRWCARCSQQPICELYREEQLARPHGAGDPDEARDEEAEVAMTIAIFRAAEETARQVTERLAQSGKADTRPAFDRLMEHSMHRGALRLTTGLYDLMGELSDPAVVGNPAVVEAMTVIGNTMMLLAGKVFRALTSRHEARTATAGARAVWLEDANGSAQVTHRVLARIVGSLTALHEHVARCRPSILSLIGDGHQLLEEIEAEFPGHRTFRAW